MITLGREVKMPALPCAEQISPDKYKQYRDWVGEHHTNNGFEKTVSLGSNRIEHGIRTNNSDLLDAGFNDIDRATSLSGFDSDQYEGVFVGILQAYRNHFWLRSDQEPVTVEDRWESYRLLGPLMKGALQLDEAKLQDNGSLPELLTHGSLLRSAVVDANFSYYPASVREAYHGGKKTTHNVIGLHLDDGSKVLHKSSAIKVSTSKKHTGRVSVIDPLKPGAILHVLCEDYLDEELVWDIANRPTKAERYLGYCQFAAQLMLKEIGQEELETFEQSILNGLTTGVQTMMNRHSFCAKKPHTAKRQIL